MKNLYWVIWCKYRKFKNPKISYILEITSVLSIIVSKGGNEIVKVFKEEESIEIIEILGILVLIENV